MDLMVTETFLLRLIAFASIDANTQRVRWMFCCVMLFVDSSQMMMMILFDVNPLQLASHTKDDLVWIQTKTGVHAIQVNLSIYLEPHHAGRRLCR